MKIRISLLVLLVCVVFAPAALAFEQDPGSDDGCGVIDPMSPCYAGTTVTYCTKPYGCPQCAMNSNTGGAVCFVLYGQGYGWCNCKPKGTAVVDGIKIATCTTSGACRTSR